MPSPSPHAEIRRAVPSDAPAVTECVNAAYARWIPIIGTKPGPMLQDYGAALASERVFVAEESGQVVGVLVLSIADEGFLLDNVAVLPTHIGRGLGGALLQLAEREAIAQGFATIYLYTHERMAGNITLYQRIGYREFARRSEHGFARVYMRKDLNAA